MTRKQIGAVCGAVVLAVVVPLLTLGVLHHVSGSAQAQPPVDLSIRVDTAGCNTASGSTTCNVPVSTQFTVTMKVEVVPPGPPGDFKTFQGYLTHTAGLTWVDRPGTGEIVWACDLPAELPGAGYYLAGCTQMFSPPATVPIDVMEVDYTCGASPSTETVTMVHGYGNNTYLQDSSNGVHVDGGIDSLTINCQAAPTEACCYPDGSCADVDPATCTGAGGTPEGAGTTCATTVCQAPPTNEIKWDQLPDESNWGLDVGTLEPLAPLVLADDFLCDESGLITEIDFWASWYHDEPPMFDPNLVAFTLSLHSDVPAGVDLPWSHPGELLWEYWFDPGQCMVVPWSDGPEGWLWPPAGYYEEVADFQIWFYQCPIPEPYWFQQEKDTVYWLDIQAVPIEPPYYFGWKTSIDHWNDASVWTTEPEPVDPLSWNDLWYPPMHPLFQNPIDLAFQLWGQECDPALDSDGDTFADDIECYLPTDRSDDCTDNPGVHDAWPLDNDMTMDISVTGDVFNYVGRVGAIPGSPNWWKRLDIDMSSDISVTGDVFQYVGKVGLTCT